MILNSEIYHTQYILYISDYQHFDARIKILGFSIRSFLANDFFRIETLMEEIEPEVTVI